MFLLVVTPRVISFRSQQGGLCGRSVVRCRLPFFLPPSVALFFFCEAASLIVFSLRKSRKRYRHALRYRVERELEQELASCGRGGDRLHFVLLQHAEGCPSFGRVLVHETCVGSSLVRSGERRHQRKLVDATLFNLRFSSYRRQAGGVGSLHVAGKRRTLWFLGGAVGG